MNAVGSLLQQFGAAGPSSPRRGDEGKASVRRPSSKSRRLKAGTIPRRFGKRKETTKNGEAMARSNVAAIARDALRFAAGRACT